MKLTELRYIVALAKESHFGRAAKRCFVSQPTLSVAVNKLESSLGVKLFERFHHEVRITDVGRDVVSQAVHVLEEVDKIKRIATRNISQLEEPLNLGAIYTVAPYVLPKIIPILQHLAKDMPLILAEAYTNDLRESLISGKLDVAILSTPFSEAGIVTRTVYKERFVCLLPKSHRLAQRPSIEPASLADEDILLLKDGHCLRQQVLEICPECENGSNLTQSVAGTSIETLKQMVASGLGITILPISSVQAESYSDLVVVKPFANDSFTREIALAWRVSFPRPKAIDVVIQSLIEAKIEGAVPSLS